jgi:hypothetical protein
VQVEAKHVLRENITTRIDARDQRWRRSHLTRNPKLGELIVSVVLVRAHDVRLPWNKTERRCEAAKVTVSFQPTGHWLPFFVMGVDAADEDRKMLTSRALRELSFV